MQATALRLDIPQTIAGQFDAGLTATATTSDDVPLFVQFGFRRGTRGGQIVSVEVGGEPVRKNTPGIVFISNPAKRQTECWWAGTIHVSPGASVHLETKVGISGVGPDTEKTTDQWFTVETDCDVREIEIRGVGFSGFPLLKGRLRAVSQRSDHDKTVAAVDAALASVDD